MPTLCRVLSGTALLMLAVVALAQSQYTSSGVCTDFTVCTYKYVSNQVHFDGQERQSFDFSCVINLACRSTGTYGGQQATKFCIDVKDVVTDSPLVADPSSSIIDDNGEEEVISELQDLINRTVEDVGNQQSRVVQGSNVNQQMFDKGFCFIRTADGKITDVEYLATENTQVVNIKKSIVSAFQANFGSDLNRQEDDVTGSHTAAYRIMSEARQGLSFQRTVSSRDVVSLAGVPRGTTLQEYEKRDDVTYDSDRILQRASGRTHLVLSKLASQSNRKRRSFSASQQDVPSPDVDAFDDDVTLDDDMTGDGFYSLVRVGCQKSLLDRLRSGRAAGDFEDGDNIVRDSIHARIDEELIDSGRMSRLRRAIPSVKVALKDLHNDPDQYKLANALSDLMTLEGERGPLSGHKPVVDDVVSYLDEMKVGKDANDQKMRALIYSMLAPLGGDQVQKKLLDVIERLNIDEERSALLTYLAFLRGANLQTVRRVEGLVQSNTDHLLLVLGSMAEYTTQKVSEYIVSSLSRRLSAVEGSDTAASVNLIHALGNTGSPAATRTLLPYLDHEDPDVVLTTIAALRMHADQPRVHAAFIKLLEESHQEEIVESIAQTLLASIKDHSLHPENHGDSTELLAAVVRSALLSNNPKLHALVSTLLEEVGTEQAQELMEYLVEFAEVDPELNKFEYDVNTEPSNGTEMSRSRRGSDWDASNSDYSIVASYSSRRNDVQTYPQHKAYIWGKRFGISKVYAHFGAGGFIGAAHNGQKYKIFAKAIAQGHAFGRTATAVHAEYLRTRSFGTVYQKIYVKIVGKVLKNEAGPQPLACIEKLIRLYQSQRIKLFTFKFSVFIYIGTLDFHVSLYVKLAVDVRFCACEHYYTSCATLIPKMTLLPSAGASATILALVRGGIDVAGHFTYQLEPELCIKVDFQPRVRITPCISVYHHWPNSYVEIYAYYQIRKLKVRWPPWKSSFRWGSKKRWSALSKKWNLSSSGRRLLSSSCGGNIICDPNQQVTGPTAIATPSTRPTLQITRATRPPFNIKKLLSTARP